MKTFTQIALLLLVVVGGVGGFTFMSQYTRKPPVVVPKSTATTPEGDKPAAALRVGERVAQWDLDDPSYAAEFERGAHGQYDFWLMNANPKPVETNLLVKGCTCSEIQLGIVAAPAWADWQRRLAALDAVANLTAGPNLAAPLALLALPPAITWEIMRPTRDHRI